MDPESPNAASLEGRNEVMDPLQGQLAKATDELVTLANKVKETMQNNATNMDVRTRMEVRSILCQMKSLQSFIYNLLILLLQVLTKIPKVSQ